MPPRSRACSRAAAIAAWSVFASAAGTACTRTEPSLFPTAAELPSGPRRPDAVAIDPATLTPAPAELAPTSVGLVTLRTPLGDAAAFEAVEAFFRVVVAEDTEALGELLSRDALVVSPTPGAPSSRTPSAANHFAQRFRRLEYGKLAGEALFRRGEVSIVHAGDARELGGTRPSAEGLLPGEVALRVPIVAARVGSERVFADEIIFYLRPDGPRFRIYRLVEDFAVP